jgi:hypothetical protein
MQISSKRRELYKKKPTINSLKENQCINTGHLQLPCELPEAIFEKAQKIQIKKRALANIPQIG